MSIDFQFKPIIRWPRAFTEARKYEPFQATYSDTLTKLKYELGKLSAENVVIQIALSERDIRKDGLPRSDPRIEAAKHRARKLMMKQILGERS